MNKPRCAAAVVLALNLVGWNVSPGGPVTAKAAGRILLTGAGATFPYPMYSKWFDLYHKLHPDIEVNYQSIGSGGGIRQVMEGTVDFGASDGPMNDEQIKQFKEKRGTEILHFPTVLGADERSSKPSGPSARHRATHFAAVLVLTPAASAATRTGHPSLSTRSTNNRRPIGLSRALA